MDSFINFKKKEKIDRFILAELVCCFMIVLSTMLMKYQNASLFFTISFVLLVVKYASEIIKSKHEEYFKALPIIIMTFLFSLFSGVFYDINLNLDYFSEMFIFLSTIIYLTIAMKIEANYKTVMFIVRFNMLIAVLYPISYLTFPQTSTYNMIFSKYITLNFSNPNLTAMWILQGLLYCCVDLFVDKSKFWKVLSVGIILFDTSLLFGTGARNAMISFILFVLVAFYVFIKPSPKFSNLFIWFINLTPSIFMALYFGFIERIIESGWFDFWSSKGKSLSSRMGIWSRIFKNMDVFEWIFGGYSTTKGNLHNSHLTILGSFGIIVLIMTVYIMVNTCKKINLQCKTKKSLICMVAFFAIVFMGFGEGSLFSGGQGIFIPACTFLIVARHNFDSENNLENLYEGDNNYEIERQGRN